MTAPFEHRSVMTNTPLLVLALVSLTRLAAATEPAAEPALALPPTAPQV